MIVLYSREGIDVVRRVLEGMEQVEMKIREDESLLPDASELPSSQANCPK